jgi:hypothetical protein
MASEDVLERAEHWSEAMRGYNPATVSTLIAVELVDCLAAEVRELRKDKARLIELFRSFARKINADGHHPAANAIEAICDAAMGGEATAAERSPGKG